MMRNRNFWLQNYIYYRRYYFKNVMLSRSPFSDSEPFTRPGYCYKSKKIIKYNSSNNVPINTIFHFRDIQMQKKHL